MKPEIVYRDICRGYSEDQEAPAYFKHLSVLETNSLADIYDKYLERSKTLKLKSEKELTEELISEGKWTRLKETSIKSCEEDISRLEISKRKIDHESAIDSIYDAIQEYKDKRISLLTEKYNHIQVSAESYANTAAREHQLFISCFKDRELKTSYFIEEFEYCDFSGLNYYNNEINTDDIKKLCISNFFVNIFMLSENLYNFFGVPLVQLTQHQINLLKYAQTYAKVASEVQDMPEKYEGNPDKMLMWFYLMRNQGGTFAQDKTAQEELNRKMMADIQAFK